MAQIELSGVRKRYTDGTEAVKGIDLTIADGELMVLVGPSGCGKTTALRMIAGLEEISAGELRIGGRLVNELPPKKRDIAMVFQNYALYPQMSVRDNMAFALKVARVSRAEIERRVREAAEVVGLTEHLDRRPHALSGGQRQRVAMGRAIVRDPRAFLMDEPLSNLDAKLRVRMRTELARLQRRLGTTTVYVTHDQTEAMTLGTRVAVMSGGELQQVDAPHVVYHDPVNAFVAGFIGSPPMNLLRAPVVDGQVKLPFGGGVTLSPQVTTGAIRPGMDEVVVGIRPEDFEHAAAVADTAGAIRFRARIEVLESMGPEVYAYFDVDRRAAWSSERPGVADSPVLTPAPRLAGQQVVMRLGSMRPLRVGEQPELAMKLAGIKLFDPRDGTRLRQSQKRNRQPAQQVAVA